MEITRASRAAAPRGATPRQVYARLRGAIEQVEFEPGQRLSENELAQRLGVSRTPIREALTTLREDRLVEVVPQLGTFVTPITRAALEDAQFIRQSLECAAVADAARAASEEDIAALRAIVARQAQTRDAHDLSRFYVLDDEFHAALCSIGSHGIAWSISQRASGHLNRVRRLSLPVADYIADMVDQHAAVLEAVAAGDAHRAQTSLAAHLSGVLNGLSEIAHQHPEYFEHDSDLAWARDFAPES